MKNQPLILLITLVVGCLGFEQMDAQGLNHPTSVYAIPLDTVSVIASLEYSLAESKTEVVVFLMPDSTYDLLLSLDSLTLTGNGPTIDSTALSTLMGALSVSAVDSAIASGFVDSSLAVQYFRVFKPAWATRYGAGLSTTFPSCNTTEFSRRTYRYEQEYGQYNTSLYSTHLTACSVCSTTCEPTVEEEGVIE